MRIITKAAIREYSLNHASAKEALNEWYVRAKAADWGSLADIKEDFGSVDYVGNDKYVFNIKGNNYRLIVRIIFDIYTIYIRFIGTHAEYNKINASTA